MITFRDFLDMEKKMNHKLELAKALSLAYSIADQSELDESNWIDGLNELIEILEKLNK